MNQQCPATPRLRTFLNHVRNKRRLYGKKRAYWPEISQNPSVSSRTWRNRGLRRVVSDAHAHKQWKRVSLVEVPDRSSLREAHDEPAVLADQQRYLVSIEAPYASPLPFLFLEIRALA